MSLPSVFTLLLLIVLYALAWHDKSGHEPVSDQRPHEKQQASNLPERTGQNASKVALATLK
jgi:hypothetical protein